MKSKEFEKFIDSSYNEELQAIYDNLKKRLNVPDDSVSAPAEIRNAISPSAAANQVAKQAAKQTAKQAERQAAKPAQKPASKRRSSFKNFFKTPVRLAACVSAAVAIVCIAIMLPFTLNNRSGLPAVTPPSTSDNPTTPEDRFCVATACQQIELKYSLKEYSARHNLSILYVDWYDVADIKTSMYVNQENSFDIIYYQEILEHKYTGSIAELYITYLNTKVDVVEGYKKVCKYRYDIANYPFGYIYWGFEVENNERNTFEAWFRYKQYVYTLVLRYPMNENSIFELIDLMLPEFKR